MKLLKGRDHEEASGLLADVIEAALVELPTSKLLVATGNTPMRGYEILAARMSAPRALAFQLDEYAGIPMEDERSLFAWMDRAFVQPLGIPNSNVRRLDGCAADLNAACAAYDAEIREMDGFDLTLLGLGPNGHLGFNEPPSEPDAPTRVVQLTEASLASNEAYWSRAVPNRALTVGMAAILASKRIVLIATGSRKRNILERSLNGPLSPEVPASLLRLAADRLTVIADWDALP